MDYVIIGEVLPLVKIPALPVDELPLEAIVLIKTVDPEGRSSWCTRISEGVLMTEAVGQLHIQSNIALRDAMATYRNLEDDDGA